jgi:cytoskeletal protein RodZ
MRLGLIALILTGLAALSMVPAVNSWISETWAGFSKQTADKNITSVEPIGAESQFTIPAPLPGDEITEPVESIVDATSADSEVASTNSTDSAANPPSNINKQENADTANAGEQTEDNKTETTETKEGTKLKFVFKKEVWMRIKDKNRKTVFESLSPAGDEKEITLKKPMTFRIGNAQGVEIYVEGKRLDITALTTGSVANFTID